MLVMLLLKSQARFLRAIIAQESRVVDPSRSLLETIVEAKQLKQEMLAKVQAIQSEQTKH